MWIIAAVLSSLFAGVAAIFSKCGVKSTGGEVATAIRTVTVFIVAWLVVFITGAQNSLANIDRGSLIFLLLSGLATSASWVCYQKALAVGEVSKVAAVDKSSTVLSILAAIAFFPSERSSWYIKLLWLAIITVGIYLLADLKKSEIGDKTRRVWFLFAFLAAVFAAATSVLAKIGVQNVDSNLATAIKTCVALPTAWLIVIGKGQTKDIGRVPLGEAAFLTLSGIAAGTSWLCSFYAMRYGIFTVVVSIDKASIVITVLFSVLFLKEKPTKKAILGLCLLLAGTILMAVTT